ncbi:MAG: GNAT family N-acetyltransferase [Rhodobacteraceae bacterium]|nr:GNAT family N-acetyltransferase [Paracoccaceae bacterium]
MTSQTFSIQTMNNADLEVAISWASAEGWNPGLEDAQSFLQADPNGFFIGKLGDTPIACVSAIKYSNAFGFVGFYICESAYRGKGYGIALWNHAFDYLKNCKTIGLDGVVDQQENYKKSGFDFAHRNIRHSGLSMIDTPMDPRLCTLGLGLFPSVRDFDRSHFPDERLAFLKSWCAPMVQTRRGFGFVEDGDLKGYGVLRQCEDGFKIGPLFSETPEVADTLFRALAGQVKGQTVILDTPEPNAAALDLAERYELSPAFETARMYKGPAPALPLDETYGITTFELG